MYGNESRPRYAYRSLAVVEFLVEVLGKEKVLRTSNLPPRVGDWFADLVRYASDEKNYYDGPPSMLRSGTPQDHHYLAHLAYWTAEGANKKNFLDPLACYWEPELLKRSHTWFGSLPGLMGRLRQPGLLFRGDPAAIRKLIMLMKAISLMTDRDLGRS